MTVVDYNPTDISALRLALQSRLADFARVVRARLLLEAVARFVATVAGVALLTYLLDWSLRLSHLTRRGLLVALIAVALVEAWRQLLAPLRMRLDPHLL